MKIAREISLKFDPFLGGHSVRRHSHEHTNHGLALFGSEDVLIHA